MDAASVFVDPLNGVLSAWKRYTDTNMKREPEYKEVCEIWGVGLATDSSTSVGSTVFSPTSGSSGIGLNLGKVTSNEQSWGSWLVCGTAGGPALNYWDNTVSGQPDWSNCGKVQLQMVKA